MSPLSLRDQLTASFSRAFQKADLDPSFGAVGISQRPDLSQFQCNGSLPAAKASRTNPRKIAQTVIGHLEDKERFAGLGIDGPGFINMILTDEFLAQQINCAREDGRTGVPVTAGPQHILIDFGGPNVAKPMHVGHLRPCIIGDCLQRVFRYAGHRVTSDIHLGDWGTQMGMLICALNDQQPDLPYFDPDFQGEYPRTPPLTLADLESMYPAANAACEKDEAERARALEATVALQQGRRGYRALWRHFRNLSLDAVRRDLQSLQVHFDLWRGESDYNDALLPLVERLKTAGVAVRSEGAWIIDVFEDTGENRRPPLLIQKRDGGYLYATTDLAAIDDRVARLQADRVLYVVDQRQQFRFQQLFAGAAKAGISGKAQLTHVGFGTINGADGKPFKTRTGGTMKLEALIGEAVQKARERMAESGIAQEFADEEKSAIAEKVGMAALKYADLMNYRESDYIFDLDRFCSFEGNTGPYLQYACVRIQSILRKTEEKGFQPGPILSPGDLERPLVLLLLKLPDVVQQTCDDLSPNILCDFANQLAQTFNRFYGNCHILSEKDEKLRGSWLSLSQTCLRQLKLVLELLGIEVPDRM